MTIFTSRSAILGVCSLIGLAVACGDSASTSSSSSSGSSGGEDSGTTSSSSGDGGSSGSKDGGADAAPAATYEIKVNVVGLTGTGLVLQNNGGDDLTLAPGATTGAFKTKLASGKAFDVTVKTQPSNPVQLCKVTGGKGSVAAGDVASVTVNCTDAHTIGGTISGLAGTGLVLQNNAGDDLTVNANGAFAFKTPGVKGDAYKVTIKSQPANPTQTCVIGAGTDAGTIDATNITTVAITCTTNKYMVKGTITGLTGTGAVIQNNGADDLTLAANATAFTFPTSVDSGANYAVTVLTAPNTPTQTCTVTKGSGKIGAGDVTDVAIACVTNKYKVSANVKGAAPAGLVLQNNGANDLTFNALGKQDFGGTTDSGGTYNVTVKTPAPGLKCTVASPTGTVTNADVVVDVNCSKYVGSFGVGSGPSWGDNPLSYSCLDACALLFGGAAANYQCSTVSDTVIDNQAWVSGWGDGSHCVGGTTVAENYKKSVNYNCGSVGCSYSAYVSDHCGVNSVNYCFAK